MEAAPLLDETKENESENSAFDTYSKHVLIPLRDYAAYTKMKADQIPNEYELKIKVLELEAANTSLPVRNRLQIFDQISRLKSQLERIVLQNPSNLEVNNSDSLMEKSYKFKLRQRVNCG